jgi:hypothetical protein
MFKAMSVFLLVLVAVTSLSAGANNLSAITTIAHQDQHNARTLKNKPINPEPVLDNLYLDPAVICHTQGNTIKNKPMEPSPSNELLPQSCYYHYFLVLLLDSF